MNYFKNLLDLGFDRNYFNIDNKSYKGSVTYGKYSYQCISQYEWRWISIKNKPQFHLSLSYELLNLNPDGMGIILNDSEISLLIPHRLSIIISTLGSALCYAEINEDLSNYTDKELQYLSDIEIKTIYCEIIYKNLDKLFNIIDDYKSKREVTKYVI